MQPKCATAYWFLSGSWVALRSVILFYLCLPFGKASKTKGFTLLELMITMIIVSVLTVIAIPAFLGQVGRARESEIKNLIGTVNRSQQAYHWETGQFAQGADDTDSLKLLSLGNNQSKYISSVNITGGVTYASIAPNNLDPDKDQIRAYAGANFSQNGSYSMIICQSINPAVNMPPPSSDNDCGSGQILK